MKHFTLIILMNAVIGLPLISVAQPTADFTFNNSCQAVSFSDQSSCSGCTIETYQWDFSNGLISTQQNPYWQFFAWGTYTVTLTVTTSGPVIETSSVTYSVTVDSTTCLPVEVIVDTVGCALMVTMSASGGQPPYTYLWSTGSTVPASVISSPGSYSVTVIDSDGNMGYGQFAVTNEDLQLESCGTISGRVFNDLNENGVDDDEPGIAGIIVRDTVSGSYGISDADGDYTVYVETNGSFVIAPWNTPQSVVCSVLTGAELTAPEQGSHAVVLQATDPHASGQDFGFQYDSPDQCGTISGTVFNDVNGNGVHDGNEPGLAGVNIVITAQPDNMDAIAQTDAQGNYSIDLPLYHTYSLNLNLSNQTYYCSFNQTSEQTFPTDGGGHSVGLSPDDPIAEGIDFGAIHTSGMDARVVNLWVDYGIHAGQNFNGSIDYKILGPFPGNCVLRIEFDPLITFISAPIPPSAQGEGFVEWTHSSPNTPFTYCMPLQFHLDSSAVAGTTLSWTATITCTGNDVCPNNNQQVRNTVVQSGPGKTDTQPLDPSHVVILHTGDPQNGAIMPEDSTFSVIINFQNSTPDTVRHVLLNVDLPSYLDPTGISDPFSLLPFRMSLFPGQFLVFEFNDLMLTPAETDPMGSYGFLQFNIRMRPDLPVGTMLSVFTMGFFNHDVDEPVIMESNWLEIAGPWSVEANGLSGRSVSVFPNPSDGVFEVMLNMEPVSPVTVAISDVSGRVLRNDSFIGSTGRITVNAPELTPGIYLLTTEFDGQRAVNRIVIQ